MAEILRNSQLALKSVFLKIKKTCRARASKGSKKSESS